MVEVSIAKLPRETGAILDVGIGAGMTGAIMRTYFPGNPIDGIELCQANKTPLWGVYRKIHLGDMRKILPNLTGGKPYALGFMLDVLEHVNGPDGGASWTCCHASRITGSFPRPASCSTLTRPAKGWGIRASGARQCSGVMATKSLPHPERRHGMRSDGECTSLIGDVGI